MYEGEWRQNQRHGRGRLETNASVFDGNWSNDMPNGRATFIDLNGTFNGDFADGKVCYYFNFNFNLFYFICFI